MLRRLHSLPGLIAALFLALLGMSGAWLALDPALERLGTPAANAAPGNVAELAGRVLRNYTGAEQIERTPNGALIVYYRSTGASGADRVDAGSGKAIGPYVRSPMSRWVKRLHRSLLLATPGRVVTGALAVLMLVLGVTGAALLARRAGGWRRLLGPVPGGRRQRWHAQLGRAALPGLLLSALTGIYLSAAGFGLVADGVQGEPDFPAIVAPGPAAPVETLAALRATALDDLRELVFPLAGDGAALYSLRTARGDAYVDPSSGALLSYRAHDGARRVYDMAYRLHTGAGWWWLGLALGLCALSLPLMGATGALTWWQRQRAKPAISGNSSAASATSVILVGSENNSTWGFAIALHDALRQAGHSVHTAAMNQLAAQYPRAERLFVLTATYGDGAAPASASQFLARLAQLAVNPATGFAVLGFGDRQFPAFCQFARQVEQALLARGWRRLLELGTVNRQSSQEFARWGAAVGDLTGQPLALVHVAAPARTFALRLVERSDYGVQEAEPTSVLRFGAPPGRRLPQFEAGDLVAVVPPGSTQPRYYSLASGARDGVLEICVRKHPNGLCSSYLHGLQPGAGVNAFIQPNPEFRPASGRAPVILIGAGTGIGPLAGFIRNNVRKHPMYLYWGGRDPASDFLYQPELRGYLADRRLTELHTAFSRVADGAHVQSRLIENAAQMRALFAGGAQVLVCGSAAMASAVVQALDQVLAPLGLTTRTLKAQGRYREDIF